MTVMKTTIKETKSIYSDLEYITGLKAGTQRQYVSNVYNIKHRAILQFIETYNCG